MLKNGKTIDRNKLEAKYQQSEKLLPAIHELLKSNNIDISKIERIKVNDKGEGFSSLRIGIVTANALAYALGIEVAGVNGGSIKTKDFSMVKPKYNQEPNIG